MKKFLAVLMSAAMLLGLLSLAGCGNANSDPAPTEDDQQTSATKLTTVNEGKLTMSTNAAFPPYEMTDDSGKIVGIDAEVAQAIAEKMGLELQIDDMDFDGALLAAQTGKSDIVMAGVTVNEDRLLVLDFSEPYANGVQVVIVKDGSDVTLDNLGKKKIGTQRGTTGYIMCSDSYGEEQVVAYDDGIAAVKALTNGQVDCVVIDNAPAKELVKANAGLKILETEFANEEYAIGVAKGNTALLEAVNTALKELIADGTVQSISDKYIPADGSTTDKADAPADKTDAPADKTDAPADKAGSNTDTAAE